MVTTSKPERAARILVQRHFSTQKQIVKYGAFLPALFEGAWLTSVFDTDGLDDEAIWDLGAVHVAAGRGAPVYGHAEITRAKIEAQSLSIERSEPPVRHCDIVGWPAAKEDRLSLAQELAAASKLKLRSQ
jgi:hypothetical protein